MYIYRYIKSVCLPYQIWPMDFTVRDEISPKPPASKRLKARRCVDGFWRVYTSSVYIYTHTHWKTHPILYIPIMYTEVYISYISYIFPFALQWTGIAMDSGHVSLLISRISRSILQQVMWNYQRSKSQYIPIYPNISQYIPINHHKP